MHQTLDLIGGLQQQTALILENPGQMTDLTGERNLVWLFLFFLKQVLHQSIDILVRHQTPVSPFQAVLRLI